MYKVVPVCVFLVPMLESFCLFVCIKLHGETPYPGFVLFPILVVDTVIHNMFVFTVASWVHNESHEVLHRLAKQSVVLGRKEKGVDKRMIKASTVFRVKVGSSNYVDKGTPLVMQDFCMNQTVNLILLQED